MLARASTHDGDIPLFLRPLDGNSSDKANLLAAVTALQDQLRAADGEPSGYVAANGIYSEANMRQLNEAGVKWVSRVSETLTQAQTILREGSDEWQRSEDGSMQWFSRVLELPQGTERWVIVRTTASLQRAQGTLQRQVSRAQTSWTQQCWHLGNRRFACEADARAALERELKGKPAWLEIRSEFVAHPHHAGKGRPRKDARPATHRWQIVAIVTVKQERVDEEALRQACFIAGTNVLDTALLSDQALVSTYKEQGGVERGFRFLKDPLAPFVLGLWKETGTHHRVEFDHGVVRGTVYRLAEFRLRSRLAETEQTIPDQVHKPTARPTMRLSCFNVLKALSYCMSRLRAPHSPWYYAFSPCIG
jgi:transposase